MAQLKGQGPYGTWIVFVLLNEWSWEWKPLDYKIWEDQYTNDFILEN